MAGSLLKKGSVHGHGYNKSRAIYSIENIPLSKRKKAYHSIENCVVEHIIIGQHGIYQLM